MVLDSSGIVDLLVGGESAREVKQLIAGEQLVHAPDVVIFEVLSALRRAEHCQRITTVRAHEAIEDLGDLPMEIYPSLALRHAAWTHRHNLRIGDALFLTLAEVLDQPLATKDRGLIAAARAHGGVAVIQLG